LATLNPGTPIDVVARGGLAAFFSGAPGVRRSLRLDAPEARPDTLRKEKYGRAYVLPASFSSAWHLFRAGVPERIGYAGDLRSPLLTKALPPEERYHYVRRYLNLLGEPFREPARTDFYFPTEEPAEFPAGPVLALAPGSRAPARRWFADRFAALIDALPPSAWASIVLLGAPEDAPHAQAVARAAKRPVLDLCGKTTLPVLGGLLKRCGALVTNESGLMHAAWAVGTPMVVLAGPSEPQCTSPFGPGIRVLQHREIPCVPCVRNDCFRAGADHMACLKAIGTTEVLSALRLLSSLPR
jgi:lipopolysaccharide heptosyltransferase II